MLEPKRASKPWYKINPFVYDRKPYKTRAIQGWHDVHRPIVLHKDPTGAQRIRRQVVELLPEYTTVIDQVQGCSSERPCGHPICPYCNLCVGIRNSTLLSTEFADPIAFTLLLEPFTEEQFATQVLMGKVTDKGRTMDNLCDHRWANKNLSTRLRKHTKDTRMVLMPDVDWDPRDRKFKPHLHGIVDGADASTIKALKKAYPGQLVYSAPVVDPLRYLAYGHKPPLLRWKHLREIHSVNESGGDDLRGMMRGVNRLLLLWKMQRPPVLLLGFADREFVGKLRSQEFALTTAMSWKPL